MTDEKAMGLVIVLSFFAFGGGGLILWLKRVFRQRCEEVWMLLRGCQETMSMSGREALKMPGNCMREGPGWNKPFYNT
jgi:hypothetical protein